MRAPSVRFPEVESIFFGGGTPSLWEARELGRVLGAVKNAFRCSDDLEVTVECNPGSLDHAQATAMVAQGVNRLSVGVQALDDARLTFLGRIHSKEEALEAVQIAMQCAPRASGDFIFATAPEIGATAKMADEVRALRDTGLQHISAYNLTIEPQTRFGELARKGRLPLATDDLAAEQFETVRSILEATGLNQYEVSNYAVRGQECRHNLHYWRGADYLGLGCGAVGTLADADRSARRYRNDPSPGRYQTRIASGELAEDNSERLDPETRLRERIMLGLRLTAGFDLTQAASALAVDPWPPERLERARSLEGRGRLTRASGHLQIPPGARLFTDGIAADLF